MLSKFFLSIQYGFIRLFCLLCFLFLLTVYSKAQNYTATEPSLLFRQYKDSKPDSEKVQLLLQLSSSYILKRGDSRNSLDSALLFAKEAVVLSDHLHYDKGREDATYLIGVVYIKRHSKDKIAELLNSSGITIQIRVILEMIRYNTVIVGLREGDAGREMVFAKQALVLSQSIHSAAFIAQSYLQLSNLYYEVKDLVHGKDFFLKALSEERAAANFQGEAEIFSQVTGNLIMDESLLEELLVSRKRLMSLYPKLTSREAIATMQHLIVMGHDQLSYYYIYKGDLNKALFYSLEMIKLLEKEGNLFLNESPYQTIGKIYLDLGRLEECIEYLQKANAIVSKKGDILDGSSLKHITKAYIGLNRPTEALTFLHSIVKHGGYEDEVYLRLLAESTGNCYYAMKQYDRAEKYYLESLRYSNKADYRSKLIAYVPLGKLYVMTRQYKKARPYLYELVKDSNRAIVPVTVQEDVHQLLFQVDSASGNLLSAIDHLKEYKALNDSIFNEKRNGQIEELKLQYETAKREKDLALKERDIQLLTRHGQLQEADLKRTRFIRNVFISGVIVLFIILGLVYNRYRFKQKTNMLLQSKQEEINRSNQNLLHLNEKQQKLITEKEWLVKEIHHRVKNNLQMIISLLNAQSEFLDHPSALSAIKESRERMQAIALIHQKLYQPDKGTLINMKSYVREMVNYLKNSFADIERIKFELNIDEITLDISQSVPVGLILNEAITNAVKYAFPANQPGKITIELNCINNQDIFLRIADNGKGFPENENLAESNSLGIQLIKLFAEQLEGRLHFGRNKGVEISVVFKKQYATSSFAY